MILLPLGAHAQEQSNFAQIWGRYSGTNLTFDGAFAQVSMTFPTVPTDNFVAGPTGITNNSSVGPIYVEAGPIKSCQRNDDCRPHPYASWEDNYGNNTLRIVTTYLLGSGGRYNYKVYYIGNSQWQAQYCDGDGCHNLGVPINLAYNRALPYVVSGGESSCLSCPIGTVLTSSNKYNPGGVDTWTLWCYSYVRKNVDGSITACDSRSHSWTVKFPK
jgi:hypothetical protein